MYILLFVFRTSSLHHLSSGHQSGYDSGGSSQGTSPLPIMQQPPPTRVPAPSERTFSGSSSGDGLPQLQPPALPPGSTSSTPSQLENGHVDCGQSTSADGAVPSAAAAEAETSSAAAGADEEEDQTQFAHDLHSNGNVKPKRSGSLPKPRDAGRQRPRKSPLKRGSSNAEMLTESSKQREGPSARNLLQRASGYLRRSKKVENGWF